MKSEERHELQQNDLASWVYTVPILLKQYGSYFLLVIACGVLAFQLWNFYQTRQQVALQNAWNELNQASEESADNPPAKFRNIITTYDVRAVQAEAYLRLGQFYLQTVLAGNPPEGFRGIKIDKDGALTQAETAFKKIISDYTDFPTSVASATLDLAAVEESRNNWDAARKDYETLTAKSSPFAGSAFAQEALYRIGNLDKYKTPVVFGPPTPKPTTTAAPATRPNVNLPKMQIENVPSLAPNK